MIPFISSRNILCIYKLIYGVGLRTLRKLFMDINPNWSNQPSDAATFDKGKMKLSKDEQVSFNKGNIKEWDFSLMTTALLYSQSCVVEIVQRPGHEAALKELKKCRNKLLGIHLQMRCQMQISATTGPCCRNTLSHSEQTLKSFLRWNLEEVMKQIEWRMLMKHLRC